MVSDSPIGSPVSGISSTQVAVPFQKSLRSADAGIASVAGGAVGVVDSSKEKEILQRLDLSSVGVGERDVSISEAGV
jgi:hypothetical protein